MQGFFLVKLPQRGSENNPPCTSNDKTIDLQASNLQSFCFKKETYEKQFFAFSTCALKNRSHI
jgi:hypothetical protein